MTTTHLHRLGPTGRRLVTPELAKGELDTHPREVWAPHCDLLERDHPLDELGEAIARLQAEIPAHSTELDARAAPLIHQALPLSRREAADTGIWRFLAVVVHPAFIRHRYEFQSWTTMRARFWRAGLRHDSNTFSRLWWIAELTRLEDDYSLTKRAFASQSLAIQVFIRSFAHYRPAAAACIDALEEQPTAIIERVLPRFHANLSTVALEGRTQAQLREILDELIDLAWDDYAR
ncbi:hypothetical protein G6O69_18525 [Pseudenhygromyxa sp. WMMC2535]|uniref:DUF6339 family protein n=1 Tax=Pseudenhygromyxa sp. WMMC2535 TaxID=2712867 RepID=UPI001556B86B|nr:hypothetical protein [Pseudenhygromyxa sp. WMMC2535]